MARTRGTQCAMVDAVAALVLYLLPLAGATITTAGARGYSHGSVTPIDPSTHESIPLAGVGAGCNIDLTTKGLPACEQVCPEWCWATVIGEMREFYTRNVSSCHLYECQVVSGVRNASCCQNSTECAASHSSSMGCGNPSSPEEIMQGFQREIPSQEWVHMHGRPGFECHPGDGCWPSEVTLQRLLMGGEPVARATHGHITVLAGCRQREHGVTEYRVLDSLKDPAKQIWLNYTILTLGPPPGQGDGPWQDTYFSNSSGIAPPVPPAPPPAPPGPPHPPPGPPTELLFDCVMDGGKAMCMETAHGFPGLPLQECEAVCNAPLHVPVY